jgi:DNA modification methylase
VNLGEATVIRGDARRLPLADNSVDLVVTSPPYFALRSYQDGGEHYAGQLGSEATPAEFVAALLDVTRECVRVLKPSGSLWVNLGDKYAQAEERSRNGNGNRVAIDNFTSGSVLGKLCHRCGADAPQNPCPYSDVPCGPRFTREKTVSLGRKDNGVPRKSLVGIPWRYALACIDDLGLILRAEVIWSKPNGLPESVTDRVRRSHEQWFHFTLSPRYFSAVDEIREAHVATVTGRDTSAWRTGPSGQNRGTDVGRRHDDGGRVADFATSPLGKLPGSVWTVPTEPLRVPDHLGIDHFAAFPTAWPKRIIQGWSPAGVCVECGEGRRPEVASVGLDMSRPQARRAQELADRHGLTEAHFKALLSVGVSDTGRGAATQNGTGKNTPEVYALADKAREALGGYAREYLLRRPTGFDYVCACPEPTAATTPAVVLDPFGGTGTTALVAKALGRHGITVDMSADYCRLATWRTNDRDQLAKVLGIEKAPPVDDDQLDLFGEATA